MKLRKGLASVFAMVLAFTLTVPALATDLRQAELNHYAYMNLETANESLKVKILEARNEIIMNSSWVADGIKGYVVDENDEIVRELPHFSECFPSDWEIPTFQNVDSAGLNVVQADSSEGEWDPREFSVFLDNPSTTQNTPPFTHIATRGFADTPYEYYLTEIMTSGGCCSSLIDNPTYNIGYSNRDTGASLGLSTRMTESQSFKIEAPWDIVVDVRASTYSTPADWILWVAGYRIDV